MSVKKKEDAPKKGAPAYMNTYGDMMTLLLTFFVLLFAMSTIDADKFQQLVSSLSHSASVSILEGGTTIKTDTNILQNGMSQFPVSENILTIQENAAKDQEVSEATAELQQYAKDQNIDSQVTIEKQGNQIVIRFDDVMLFDVGKAELKAGAIPTLNKIGNQLQRYIAQGYMINIEGHTDNRPIHTAMFPSNWELSGARAIAVMRFYIEQMDFDMSKVSYVGKAEFQPIASNDTEEGRAKNRRVEIILSKSTS